MNKTATELDGGDYLRSLGLPRPIARADGAHLFQVGFQPDELDELATLDAPHDELFSTGPHTQHYVLMVCALDHGEYEHPGHQQIVRRLPREWVVFAQFFTEDGKWDIFHVGPPEPEPVSA